MKYEEIYANADYYYCPDGVCTQVDERGRIHDEVGNREFRGYFFVDVFNDLLERRVGLNE